MWSCRMTQGDGCAMLRVAIRQYTTATCKEPTRDDMANKNDRKHIWWRRWLDRLLLGVVSAAVFWVLLPLAAKFFSDWRGAYERMPGWLPEVALSIIVLAALGVLCSKRWAACLGVRHFWRDPPIWVSIGTAAAALVAVTPHLHGVFAIPFVKTALMWLGYGLGIIVGLAALRWFCCEPRKPENSGKKKSESVADLTDFKAIKKWVSTDKPISKSDEDRFGYNAIAERIASRLTEGQSVAVVGALGSGKTTTGKLVEQHLKPDQTLFLQISLWPYESAQAAANGILSALIETLGRETQTIELRGLPASYLDATAAAGGWVATLARLGRTESEPKQIVERLDRLCKRIGRKLVLWVDDAERFSGRRSADGALPADFDERYGPIRALLHLLDDAEWIVVVTADTGLETRLDPDKVARFVERLPEVAGDTVRKLLGTVRERCTSDWPRKVTVPKRAEGSLDDVWRLGENVARVVVTPRTLKQCLRLVIETWNQLAGEIDFDSMLAITALRVAHPDLFATLERYSSALRNEKAAASEKANGETEFSDLEATLTRQLDGISDPTKREACLSLLRVLITVGVPRSSEGIEVPKDRQGMRPVQHIFHSGKVNYFRRYQTQTRDTSPPWGIRVSDQGILAAIHTAIPALETKGDSLTKLLELLLDDQVAWHVGVFFAEFEMEQIETLLERVVDAEIDGGQRLLGTHVIVEMLRSKWAEDHYGMDSGNRTPWEDLFGRVFDRLFDSDLINACRFVKQVSPKAGLPMAGEAFREHVKRRMREMKPDEAACLRKWADEPSEPEPQPEPELDSPANAAE